MPQRLIKRRAHTRTIVNTMSILDKTYALSKELPNCDPPTIEHEYTSVKEWSTSVHTMVSSGTFDNMADDMIVPLSTNRNSMYNTVITSKLTYGSKKAMTYLFTHWEGMVHCLIEQGKYTIERYDSLIDLIQTHILELKSQISDISGDIGNHELFEEWINLSEKMTLHLRLLARFNQKKSYIKMMLKNLSITECISCTKLALIGHDEPTSSAVHPSERKYYTLCDMWPSLFKTWNVGESMDDRSIFVENFETNWSTISLRRLSNLTKSQIPSGFDIETSYPNFVGGRPGSYLSRVGKKGYRLALMLRAFDSVASHMFTNPDEYINWVKKIGSELNSAIGTPPLPAINAVPLLLLLTPTDEDVDPITLEPFKSGDEIYTMNCCKNNILKTSIHGILESDGPKRCPLCRTNFLV